jgi:hypothetical protein
MKCVRARLLYDRFQVIWATTLTVCIWPILFARTSPASQAALVRVGRLKGAW